MIFPINEICNQNCLFCSAQGRGLVFDKKEAREAIKKCQGTLTISGGEPTLSPDLFWVIELAKKQGLNVELQSNGATLYYKSLAKKLLNKGVDLFNINFPSHIPEIDEAITRTRGFFEKKFKGIKNLQSLEADIRLTCIVNAFNYESLVEYVKFIYKFFPGIKIIQFSFIKISQAAQKNNSVLIDYQKAQPNLLKAMAECSKLKIEFIADHIPPCYLGEFKNRHIDLIRDSKNIDSVYSQQEKRLLADCKECSLFKVCKGVRKDYLEYFGRQAEVFPIV